VLGLIFTTEVTEGTEDVFVVCAHVERADSGMPEIGYEFLVNASWLVPRRAR
jgi:hypothetical protein